MMKEEENHLFGGSMKKFQFLFFLLVALALTLSACAPAATDGGNATPEPAASEAPSVGESAPKVGGELVWALPAEPDTLDWHLGWSLYTYYVDSYISASLLYLDADKNIIPYLAESYTVSDDGLVYEFKLRPDVKFHDGTPLTAQDYAWTLNRAIDPETASPVAGTMFGPVDKIEAVDDSTLRITLTDRFAPLLFNLSDPGYTGPMSKAAFEKMGAEEFARAPVGVGPYKVKEWVTGERIVLERNPDYNWGSAAYQNRGAYYIETLTFRPIMESATLLAGLQAGEIQFAQLERKDVANFQNSSDFTLFSQTFKGANGLLFNVSKSPFDDMRVRKAFNLAIDRQAIIDVVLFGMGEIQYGPLSKPQIGYWEGKDVGYNFDLETAKALMQEAGYTYNAAGMLEKDGKPFSLTLLSSSAGADTQSKMAQVAQQQLKTFGVDVTIEQLEDGVLWEKIIGGDYELSVLGYTGPEADLLYLLYHSTGGLNMSHVSDPELDALLDESRAAPDAASRQAKLDALQKLIVEKAYTLPIFVPTDYYALDSRIAGSNLIFFDVLNLADAYYK
jgi:peptide/nickel transport system substrate-binding protein